MIDTTRHYTTRSGAKVTIHDIVPFNCAGRKATFPVKGNVRELVKQRHRNRYQIWRMDGRACARGEHPDDIVDLCNG
jgi:hypothetical protein